MNNALQFQFNETFIITYMANLDFLGKSLVWFVIS